MSDNDIFSVEINEKIDNLKILIVDDHADVLEVIETKLELEFPLSEIRKAQNGVDALAKITEDFIPDLIITDLKMPEMSGIKLAKEVLKKYPKVPIILHSSYMDILELIENIEIGFQGFLEKPATLEQVAQEVKRTLSKAQKNQEGYILYDVERLLERDVYPFDLYVRLGSSKFIHVFKKGDNVHKEKLNILKTKGVGELYIRSEDYLSIDDSLYAPVRVSTLVKNELVDFALFRRGSCLKFEQLIKANTVLVDGHQNILKKHGIKQLFVAEVDEPKYQAYLDRVIDKIVEAKETPCEDCTVLVNDYTKRKVDRIFKDPSRDNLHSLKKVSSTLVKFISGSMQNGLKDLLHMQKGSGVYQHALRVATISLAIMEKIFIDKKEKNRTGGVSVFESILDDNAYNRDIILLGGLLHDIGKVTLGIETFVNLDDTTEEVRKNYLRHIEVGESLLVARNIFPEKILEIVRQHHECMDGTGFPNKLMKRHLSIHTQIISLANFYDGLISTGYKVHDAVVHIQMSEAKFNKHLIPFLQRVVQPDQFK
ncbi:MAG: hypothetical protein A2504_00020 [Bdellovibrionales bacterium RIFOXYD12_FULL_39_22]|nr:MAG: hypothetical protein A2385_15005 [Bdellovibrionales bacterium RIFOXYB1_FULL_39_21]OFZ43748.1 MAG: hypothetical protein A2485_07830 [Bdellovibrionales bacterium RIFOXYC12_FULL_39_17]OFZ48081.1 MAG: hypothetical protein A2404_15660 [Bdellovibrionales bacterium RIFOXYC1_FULL_39_130]OFZ77256.1 MAG: hypothetical protein A2560_08325 [Bdellovibrionales bacterium RIFOXYD1_FULL_39_84]OFZ95684.1 MAG: hypothetical protein A2504_00020 [Bdellovibrionales bacterium RIFOXYD12_FULL_39_22]HLE11452.1 re